MLNSKLKYRLAYGWQEKVEKEQEQKQEQEQEQERRKDRARGIGTEVEKERGRRGEHEGKKRRRERERERDRERLRADSRTVVRVIHDAQRRVRAGERVVLAQLHVTLGTAPNNDRTQRKTYFRAPGWGRRIRRGSFGEGLSSQVPHRPAAGSRGVLSFEGIDWDESV